MFTILHFNVQISMFDKQTVSRKGFYLDKTASCVVLICPSRSGVLHCCQLIWLRLCGVRSLT